MFVIPEEVRKVSLEYQAKHKPMLDRLREVIHMFAFSITDPIERIQFTIRVVNMANAVAAGQLCHNAGFPAKDVVAATEAGIAVHESLIEVLNKLGEKHASQDR